jgi:hypothetical protein
MVLSLPLLRAPTTALWMAAPVQDIMDTPSYISVSSEKTPSQPQGPGPCICIRQEQVGPVILTTPRARAEVLQPASTRGNNLALVSLRNKTLTPEMSYIVAVVESLV